MFESKVASKWAQLAVIMAAGSITGRGLAQEPNTTKPDRAMQEWQAKRDAGYKKANAQIEADAEARSKKTSANLQQAGARSRQNTLDLVREHAGESKKLEEVHADALATLSAPSAGVPEKSDGTAIRMREWDREFDSRLAAGREEDEKARVERLNRGQKQLDAAMAAAEAGREQQLRDLERKAPKKIEETSRSGELNGGSSASTAESIEGVEGTRSANSLVGSNNVPVKGVKREKHYSPKVVQDDPAAGDPQVDISKIEPNVLRELGLDKDGKYITRDFGELDPKSQQRAIDELTSDEIARSARQKRLKEALGDVNGGLDGGGDISDMSRSGYDAVDRSEILKGTAGTKHAAPSMDFKRPAGTESDVARMNARSAGVGAIADGAKWLVDSVSKGQLENARDSEFDKIRNKAKLNPGEGVLVWVDARKDIRGGGRRISDIQEVSRASNREDAIIDYLEKRKQPRQSSIGPATPGSRKETTLPSPPPATEQFDSEFGGFYWITPYGVERQSARIPFR